MPEKNLVEAPGGSKVRVDRQICGDPKVLDG